MNFLISGTRWDNSEVYFFPGRLLILVHKIVTSLIEKTLQSAILSLDSTGKIRASATLFKLCNNYTFLCFLYSLEFIECCNLEEWGYSSKARIHTRSHRNTVLNMQKEEGTTCLHLSLKISLKFCISVYSLALCQIPRLILLKLMWLTLLSYHHCKIIACADTWDSCVSVCRNTVKFCKITNDADGAVHTQKSKTAWRKNCVKLDFYEWKQC